MRKWSWRIAVAVACSCVFSCGDDSAGTAGAGGDSSGEGGTIGGYVAPSISTMRRTVVEKVKGLTTVVAEDGTLWTTTAKGIERKEGVSGFKGVGLRYLDKYADVRTTEFVIGALDNDGTVPGTTLTQVAAIRPYGFMAGNTLQDFPRYIKTDGSALLGLGADPSSALSSGVMDIAAGGYHWQTAGGIWEETNVGRRLVVQSERVKSFEGATYSFYEGQRRGFAHFFVALTEDRGALQYEFATLDNGSGLNTNEFGPAPLATSTGVAIDDVFASETGVWALGVDGKLYAGLPRGILEPTTFPRIRKAKPAPDVAVYFAAGADVQIMPDTSVVAQLQIHRESYADAVTLTPKNLERGISIAPLTIPSGATSAQLKVDFGGDVQIAPHDLEFWLRGPGIERTVLLEAHLPRRTVHRTFNFNCAVKTDGTVWRIRQTPATQVLGLADIVAVAPQLALDRNGTVFAFDFAAAGQVKQLSGFGKAINVASRGDVWFVLNDAGEIWSTGFPNSPLVIFPTEKPTIDLNTDANGLAILPREGLPAEDKTQPVANRLGMHAPPGAAGAGFIWDIQGNGIIQNRTAFPPEPNRVLWASGHRVFRDGTTTVDPTLTDVNYTVPAEPVGHLVLLNDGTLLKVLGARTTLLTGVALVKPH